MLLPSRRACTVARLESTVSLAAVTLDVNLARLVRSVSEVQVIPVADVSKADWVSIEVSAGSASTRATTESGECENCDNHMRKLQIGNLS